MKRIICITLAAAMLTLTSCGEKKTENTSSAPTQYVSSAVASYLDSAQSDTVKYITDNELSQHMYCEMKLTRKGETDEVILALDTDNAYVELTEEGQRATYYSDSFRSYRLNAADKTATLVNGTEPYAITLVKGFGKANNELFIEKGTKEVDGKSYKYEVFQAEAGSFDRIGYYLNEDNSFAYAEYLSASSESYNVFIEFTSINAQPDSELFGIPEDYKVIDE